VSEIRAFDRELDVARAAAREAGEAILSFYNQQSAGIYEKSDGSVVTDADLASDAIIRERITQAFPDDPLLTEEGIDDRGRLQSRRCWIVDPIDGTQQYVDRTGEFEVLIALVQDGRPVLGVAYQPTADVLISAVHDNGAATERNGERSPLRFTAVNDRTAPRIITSTWLGAPENMPMLNAVSASLDGGPAMMSDVGITVRRFIPPTDIADALIGMRVSPEQEYAWEWDFAAADVIMFEAGGALTDLTGKLHRYNKPVPRNIGGIVMAVDPTTQERVVAALASEVERIQAGAGA
jgi:3'-phosphoadenosine 5'-phosphosulfate (PAPS) 3'-phosphatase